MNQTTKNELIEKIATQFEEIRYVDDDFIVENNISAANVVSVWTHVADILRGYLNAPDTVQFTLVATGSDEKSDGMVRLYWEVAAERLIREREGDK